MHVQQVHLADIKQMANLHRSTVSTVSTSTCCGRYVPVARQGSVRDQTQKVGTPKERPTSGPVLGVDVSLCLDLQVGLRLWISPGQLWKHSFSPSASQGPINAYGSQNGFLTYRKGIRPNSSPLEQVVPNGHNIYPWALGSLFRIRAREHCRRRPSFSPPSRQRRCHHRN